MMCLIQVPFLSVTADEFEVSFLLNGAQFLAAPEDGISVKVSQLVYLGINLPTGWERTTTLGKKFLSFWYRAMLF